jgi:hypothetical protein
VKVPEGVYSYYINALDYSSTEFKKLSGTIIVYR